MKQSADEILAGVAAALREVLGKPELVLAPSTRQDDVEGWDSLAQIQLVLALGKRFGVKFTTREVMDFTDAGSIVACIERKLA